MATNEKDLEFERALEERKEDSIELLDVKSKMEKSFLNYAMSVIIARALPDARVLSTNGSILAITSSLARNTIESPEVNPSKDTRDARLK